MPDPAPRIRRLGPQRFRARGAILAAVALVVALSAALFVATTGYLDSATTSGARSLIRAAPADAASLVIETHLADDVDAQSARAIGFIGEWFAATPVDVFRTVRAGVVKSADASGRVAGPDVLVIADPALPDDADLVDGAWPDPDAAPTSGPIPAALQADAAEALQLGVGDEIRVGSVGQQVRLVLAATWRATGAAAPRFAGEPATASGASGAAVGPFVVSEAALVTLPAGAYVRWTITPRVDELTAASIAELAPTAQSASVAEGIRRFGGITDESTTVTGRLAETAERVAAVSSAASAVSSIPLALTGAIALITLLQLSSLLAGSRQGETYMFRARGASTSQLARWSLLEAAVVVVPAALVGAAAGYLVAAQLAVSSGPTVAQLASSAAVIVVAVVVLGVRGLLAARAGVTVGGRAASGVLSVVLIVLAVVAAGISTWQLLLYGPGTVSPLAALAPTLLVAAMALALGTLLSPLAAAVATGLARVPSLIPGLAARQVARQAAIFAVASLVVALATGGVTVATAISSQIAQADARATTLSTGSDVRVRLTVQGQISDGTAAVSAGPYAALDGSTAAAMVLAQPATIGADTVDLVAIARESLEPVVSADSGVVGVPDLVAALGSETTPAVLPDDADTISVSITSIAASPDREGGVRVQAWLADATGALAKVDLGSVAFSDPALETGAVTAAAIPQGSAPWSLLAVDTSLVGAPSSADLAIRIAKVAAGGTVLQPDLAPTAISSQRVTDRSMVYSQSGADLGGTPLGVIVTDELARRAGLAAGETFDLTLSTGRALAATIVGTAPVIPGSTAELGMLVDLVDLDAAMLADRGPVLQAADVWIASSAPATTAEAASRVSRYPASVQDRASASVSALLDPTVRALVADLAGVVIIALIAFAATAATLVRSRRDEGTVLSALGVPARGQAGLRGAELAAVTLFAAVTGIVAGVVASVLCAGMLAASAVPGSPGGFALPRLDSALLPLAIVIVALLAIVAGYAAVVGRSLALRRPSPVTASNPGGVS